MTNTIVNKWLFPIQCCKKDAKLINSALEKDAKGKRSQKQGVDRWNYKECGEVAR